MSDTPYFKIQWIDRRREPECAPNPAYPDGMDVDMTNGQQGCIAPLPYPAKRCGAYVVECLRCGSRNILTTAGRPDDPRSVKVACKGRSAVPMLRDNTVVVSADDPVFDGTGRKPTFH